MPELYSFMNNKLQLGEIIYVLTSVAIDYT